jgi:centromeric protein E
LQQELLAARRQLESQSNQILSLEAALAARPVLPVDAQPSEKDRLLEEQRLTIEDLRKALAGFEANLGEPLRKVKEDVEEEFREKMTKLENANKEAEAWAAELVRQLEREKQVHPFAETLEKCFLIISNSTAPYQA